MEHSSEQFIVSVVAKEHDSYYEFLMDDSFRTDYKDLLDEEAVLREWLDNKAKQGFNVNSGYKHGEKVARIKEKFKEKFKDTD